MRDGAQLDRPLRAAVIGGGPAGACTAETLAKGGIETYLIERKLDNCKVLIDVRKRFCAAARLPLSCGQRLMAPAPDTCKCGSACTAVSCLLATSALSTALLHTSRREVHPRSSQDVVCGSFCSRAVAPFRCA